MASNTTTQSSSSSNESMVDTMLKDLLRMPQPELSEFIRMCQEPPSGYWNDALRACNGLKGCEAEPEPARYPGLLMVAPGRAPGLLMIKDPAQRPMAPELGLPRAQEFAPGLLRVRNPAHFPMGSESGLPSSQASAPGQVYGQVYAPGLFKNQNPSPAPQSMVYQIPPAPGYPQAQNYGAPPTGFFRSALSNNLQSELQDMRNDFQAFQHHQNLKMEDLESRYSYSKDQDQELEQLRREKEEWLLERQRLLAENNRLSEALEAESEEKKLLEDSIQEYRYDADLDSEIRKDVENQLERKDSQIKDLLEILETMGKTHREEIQNIQESMDLDSEKKKELEAEIIELQKTHCAEIEHLKSSLASESEKLAAKTLEFKKSKKSLEKKIEKLEKKVEAADLLNFKLENNHVEHLKAFNEQGRKLNESMGTTKNYLEQLIESNNERTNLLNLTMKLREKLAEERRGKNQ